MKKANIHIGPGAASLILIFVMLAMGVLAVLDLSTAKNDANLSRRSAQVAGQVYALNAAAEETFARLEQIAFACRTDGAGGEDYLTAVAAALPESCAADGADISWEETDGVYTLYCGVRLGLAAGEKRLSWKRHALTMESGEEEFGFDF